jgi:hypothetical protein
MTICIAYRASTFNTFSENFGEAGKKGGQLKISTSYLLKLKVLDCRDSGVAVN